MKSRFSDKLFSSPSPPPPLQFHFTDFYFIESLIFPWFYVKKKKHEIEEKNEHALDINDKFDKT